MLDRRRRLLYANNYGKSGVVSVPAPTLVSLNQDYSSTAGGDTIIGTGTNLGAATSFSIGGTTATATPIDATHASFVCPAKVANAGYDVTVTNAGGTSPALTASLEYRQAATTTLVSIDGNNGALAPFSPGLSANCIVDVAAAPVNWRGTHSIRYTSNATSSGQGCYLLAPPVACDTTSYPNGIWCEFVVQIPAATLAAMNSQIKLHLFRNVADTQFGDSIGIGTDYGHGNKNLTLVSDDNGVTFSVDTGVVFGDLVQVRVLVFYSWNGTVGTTAAWVNGKKIAGASVSSAVLLGNATDFKLQTGIAFAGNAPPSAPLVVYNGLVRMLDGCPVQLANYATFTPQAKAFVGATAITVNGTNSVTTPTFAVPLGATIRVGTRCNSVGGTTTVTDNLGNVYTRLGMPEIVSPGNTGVSMFVAINKTAVGTNGLTVTVTSNSDTMRGGILVSTGDDPISGYDQGNITPACIGTSATADSGAMTGTGGPQFSWSFVSVDVGRTGYTSTGWTTVAVGTGTAFNYRIDATPTLVHCTPALVGGSTGWVAIGGTTL